MSFLKELLSVDKKQLRKVKVNDKSDPLRCGFSTQQEIVDYHTYIAKFNSEQWISKLGNNTFETEYVEVTLEEARELHKICEEIEQFKNTNGDTWTTTNVHNKLEISVCDRLPSLIKKIDIAIREKMDSQPVFAKMSCRSAKDVITSRLKLLFDEKKKELETDTDNNRIALLLQLSTDLMCLRSGNEIVESFTLSERILGDIGCALQYPEKFNQNVVLRKWCPIDVGLEFRGFVSNNTFTALSQYNYFVYYPVVVSLKQSIQDRIKEFWTSTIREKLSDISTYVIDFCLYPSPLSSDLIENIKVIEINPFYDTTGAALFSWNSERDVLENGPFEFRITTEIPKKRPELESEYHGILGWE